MEKVLLLSPFYRWANQGLEKLNNFSKVTHKSVVEPGCRPRPVWLQSQCSCYYAPLGYIPCITDLCLRSTRKVKTPCSCLQAPQVVISASSHADSSWNYLEPPEYNKLFPSFVLSHKLLTFLESQTKRPSVIEFPPPGSLLWLTKWSSPSLPLHQRKAGHMPGIFPCHYFGALSVSAAAPWHPPVRNHGFFTSVSLTPCTEPGTQLA